MSYPKFKVGEMVIMVNATYFTETDWMLGIITLPLAVRLCTDLHLMKEVWSHVYGVKVLMKGEPKLCCRPWQIRKLHPGDDNNYVAKKSEQRRQEKRVKQSCS